LIGVLPDLVCSGHVHNYQRFLKRYGGEKQVPYIVVGAGGYADLHSIALENDATVRALHNDGSITLKASCDNCFGFLKLGVRKVNSTIQIHGEYYTLSAIENTEPSLYDSFKISVSRSAELQQK